MFPKTIFLLFFVYNSYQINDEKCGHKKSKKFIIGGSDAEEHEFPFIVSILYNGKHRCTGSLITNEYVLTAAHCLTNKEPKNMTIIIGTNNNEIRNLRSFGGLWGEPLDENQTMFKIKQIIINGCFDKRDFFDSDIGLIKLEQQIQINDRIGTICLPPTDTEPINSEITIAGWGIWEEKELNSNPESPNILQKTRVELFPEEYCHIYLYFGSLGLGQFSYLGNKICVQSDTATACVGDSGGPAFQEVNEKWYQIGITSYIYPAGYPSMRCVKSAPVVYTKVSQYIHWIKQMIEMDSNEEIIESSC